jgi:hypothetical protein
MVHPYPFVTLNRCEKIIAAGGYIEDKQERSKLDIQGVVAHLLQQVWIMSIVRIEIAHNNRDFVTEH